MGGTSDFLCTVYAETPVGSQTMLAVASTAKSNAVVQRDSSGRFEVASPTSDNDCATKKYVDDAVAGASSGGGGRVSSFAWRADSFGAQVSSKTISMPSFTASELKNALIFVRGTYQYTDSELSAWQTTMCTAEYPLPGRVHDRFASNPGKHRYIEFGRLRSCGCFIHGRRRVDHGKR